MASEMSVVTSKGQVVIPAPLRRRMRIRKGTRVAFQQSGTAILMEPITPEYIRSLRGIAKVKKGQRSALDYLLEERRREREL